MKKALSLFILLALLPLWLMAAPSARPKGKEAWMSPPPCGRFIDQDSDGRCNHHLPLQLMAPLISGVADGVGEPMVPDNDPAPYSPLAWSVLPMLAYALTSALSRAGKIKKQTHRYLWNVALLTVFAITCGFGMVLACDQAYDWNLSIHFYYWMKTWHVNAGIFMLATGVLHLSRRFHYFLKPPHHGKQG